ncbi:MAG: hypothetical protein HZB26_22865 [Candidatus Hydrogenedentes bacterium]|nr:hypothetical protein [Candidatus Hydrogenedentota bacterium]
MKATTKNFDCVEMKRRGAARVRADVKDMTKAEQLDYWRKGTAELLAVQATLRKTKKAATRAK